MKKLLFSLLFFSAIAWLWIGHMIAADGVLQNLSGTTSTGGSVPLSAFLTNNSTIGWTNTGNIQSATLNTTGNAIITGSINVGADGALAISTGLYAWGGGFLGFTGTGTGASGVKKSYFEQPVNGTMLLNTNLIARGLITATNGFASFASDAGVALQATGITNSLGKNAMAYVTATAVAFTIKDAASTTLYTSPTLTATMSVQLHPGWSVNAASGLSGTMLPE